MASEDHIVFDTHELAAFDQIHAEVKRSLNKIIAAHRQCLRDCDAQDAARIIGISVLAQETLPLDVVCDLLSLAVDRLARVKDC